MLYKTIGGITLPAIGQGGMGIGGYFDKDESKDLNSIQALEEGIKHGATLFDTAESYGKGHSEEVIGRISKGRREKLFLATKFSPENSQFNDVIAAVDKSLSRLGTEYIDLYQFHWPNSNIPLDETISALDMLVSEGKIRHIGVSNFSLQELKNAQSFSKNKISFAQAEYNLFDRTIEQELLSFCQQNDIFIIAYSPTDQGLMHFSQKQHFILDEIAKTHNVSKHQIALHWVALQKNVIAIPKSSNITHARDNALSADFCLTNEELTKIAEHFPMEPTLIPVQQISPISPTEHGRKIYHTKQQALDNYFNFVPSPKQLAEEIIINSDIKPIRVKQIDLNSYVLLEGRIRFWAWMIAFGDERPVPCLIHKL